MMTSERVRKLFSSPIFLFLFYSFFFGVLLQFFAAHDRPFSWTSVPLFGVPAGIIVTVITMLQIKKFNESLGLTDPKQIEALHTAIKTGEPPHDPQVRKALPIFLHKRFPTTKKLRGSMIFLGIIGFLNLLPALVKRDLVGIGCALAFLMFFAAMYHAARRSAAKADRLYKQLGVDPELITTIPRYPDLLSTTPNHSELATAAPDHTADPAYGASDDERNRSKWVLIAAAIAVTIALILSWSFKTQQQIVPTTSSSSSDDPAKVQTSTNADTIEGVEPLPDQGTITIEQPDTSNDAIILQDEPVADPNIYNVENEQSY